MKKTLALLVLSLLAGCEDWKIDMVGDHQPDDEYDHHSYGCSSCSSAPAPSAPAPPAMLPAPSPSASSSTGDGGAATNDDDGAIERTSNCVGSDPVCEFQITIAACEAWPGCTWIPR